MRKHISRVLGHPLFSGSAIMIIGSNSTSTLNFLYHFVLARLLGPASYGELVSLISVIGLFGIIPGVISLVIVKQVSSAKSELEVNNLVIWFKTKIFIISLISSLSVLIFAPFIFSFLHVNKIYYLVLISLSFLFSLQSLFYRAVLQGLLKFKELITSLLVENITKLIISIFLVYIGWSVGGAMIAFLIATVIGWYITFFYLRYFKKNNSSPPKNIKPMIGFSIPVLIQSISMTSLYSSDIILVKHFFSSFDSGIYASISTLGKIIFFATGPISSVMFPLVSQRQSRGQNHKNIFVMSFLVTGVLALGVLLIYWFFPQLAIELVYGKLYLSGANLLVWYGVFMTLFTLSGLLIIYGLSIGRTRIVLFSVAAALTQIILIWSFHNSLWQVITISIFVTALLLACLFIYSSYDRNSRNRDKVDFSNSPSI